MVTPVSPVPGSCTLAELEQETASRLGPFALLEAASGGDREIVVEVLRSTVELGGWVDLHLLRRGATQAPDRQARVKSYDPALGKLEPDRSYVSPPVGGEAVEAHHLPPELLRRIVRAGLARCWMRYGLHFLGEDPDDPLAPFVPETGAIDLTAYAPWLTLPQQVVDVLDPTAGRSTGGTSVPGWTVYGHAGHAWLTLPRGTRNPGLGVIANRAHFGYVNGADAPGGPTADGDVLALPVQYGAALAHAEAWRIARDRLETVAAEGRMPSQAEAAAEATRAAVSYAPWLFAGGREDRIGPLLGLRGATRTTAPGLEGALVNGPLWMAPTPAGGAPAGGPGTDGGSV